MQLTPIGIIHSPYKERGEAPRQGRLSDAEFTLEIFPPFAAALEGIERCSHLIVLYWGDRAGPPEAAIFALQMLLATESGGLDTRTDWDRWLVEVGFLLPKKIELPAWVGSSLTVARKPELDEQAI